MSTKSSLCTAALISALMSSAAAMAQAPGYYVAPTGKDNAPGTLEAPFATIDKCLTAMRASSSQKTCYIRAGEYPHRTATGQCYGNPFALLVTDNGVTLSHYPPDGYGSAKISGAGGSAEGGICLKGSGITVDGLDIGFYPRFAISSENINNTIDNNTLHDTTIVQSNGTLFMNANIRGNKARHNYVYNSANNGIVAQPNAANNLDGVEIDNNFVFNSTTNCTDCGAIYTQDVLFSTGSTTRIRNNYVLDISTKANIGSKGIYIDDGSSGHIVTGNVVRPGAGGWACWQIHGGKNNTISGNICDENGASVPGGVVFYQTSGSQGTAMSGNLVEHNIILTATGNAGGGYTLDGSPSNKLTVRDNDYFGYGSATPSHSGSAAVGGGDSSRANVDPGFGCDYTLPADSPVYGAPTRFPAQQAGWGTAGFWGPPGFVIPREGTPPSPPCSATAPPNPGPGGPATMSCSFTSPPITVIQGGAAVPVPPLALSCK